MSHMSQMDARHHAIRYEKELGMQRQFRFIVEFSHSAKKVLRGSPRKAFATFLIAAFLCGREGGSEESKCLADVRHNAPMRL